MVAICITAAVKTRDEYAVIGKWRIARIDRSIDHVYNAFCACARSTYHARLYSKWWIRTRRIRVYFPVAAG